MKMRTRRIIRAGGRRAGKKNTAELARTIIRIDGIDFAIEPDRTNLHGYKLIGIGEGFTNSVSITIKPRHEDPEAFRKLLMTSALKNKATHA